MEGWIKDHRRELESDIWIMPPLYHRIWQYLKYTVNHEPKSIPMSDGTTFDILPGQHLTSIRGIAKGIGWYEGLKWREPNPKTVKVILDWLERHEMISISSHKGNRQYTLITLTKWETYQSKSIKGNAKVTVKKQTPAINKNEKNEKNNIQIIIDSYGCGPDLKQTLSDFVEHRKAIKSPLTEHSLKLLLQKLDKLASTDPAKKEIIEQSIMNGWRGIFQLSADKQNEMQKRTEGDTYAGYEDFTGKF